MSQSDINERLKSHNSANVLCNFMRERRFLENALSCMAFKPRYFEEKIDYLNLSSINAISFPMTCFCDIPFSKVSKHTDLYGCYGLALDKSEVLKKQKDIQPILYINPSSDLCKYFAFALDKMIEQSNSSASGVEELHNYILSQLLYCKPIIGIMEKDPGSPLPLNFKDECEWRFIPNIPDDFPLILRGEYNNFKARNSFSDGLAEQEQAWLHFEPEDIRYIIVPNADEADILIGFINGLTGLSKKESNSLIRKIEVLEYFTEDYV